MYCVYYNILERSNQERNAKTISGILPEDSQSISGIRGSTSEVSELTKHTCINERTLRVDQRTLRVDNGYMNQPEDPKSTSGIWGSTRGLSE